MVEAMKKLRPNLKLETEPDILSAEELPGGAAGYSVPERKYILRVSRASARLRVARNLYVYPTARWI